MANYMRIKFNDNNNLCIKAETRRKIFQFRDWPFSYFRQTCAHSDLNFQFLFFALAVVENRFDCACGSA